MTPEQCATILSGYKPEVTSAIGSKVMELISASVAEMHKYKDPYYFVSDYELLFEVYITPSTGKLETRAIYVDTDAIALQMDELLNEAAQNK